MQVTTYNSPSARVPSSAPTKVDDPDPQLIHNALTTLGIKIHDYAYQVSAFTQRTQDGTLPTPAVEIFDPYIGIAEFEFRLAQVPRRTPIQGKTTRRLFELGWVTQEEANLRLHPIDWAALKAYEVWYGINTDQKGMRKGEDDRPEEYPWRPYKWGTIPTMRERGLLVAKRGAYFLKFDYAYQQLAHAAAKEEMELAAAESAKEHTQLMVRDVTTPLPLPWKRRKSPPSSTDPKAKRRCLFNAPPALPKQFPAPLSEYSHKFYPYTIGITRLPNCSPLEQCIDTPLERSDTPPLDEDEEEEPSPMRRVRGLHRTQTYYPL